MSDIIIYYDLINSWGDKMEHLEGIHFGSVHIGRSASFVGKIGSIIMCTNLQRLQI